MMKTISVFIALVVGVADAKVGELKTYKYETSGTVYIKNDKELVIDNFKYNGRVHSKQCSIEHPSRLDLSFIYRRRSRCLFLRGC